MSRYKYSKQGVLCRVAELQASATATAQALASGNTQAAATAIASATTPQAAQAQAQALAIAYAQGRSSPSVICFLCVWSLAFPSSVEVKLPGHLKGSEFSCMITFNFQQSSPSCTTVLTYEI
jgi:hypothetical protein